MATEPQTDDRYSEYMRFHLELVSFLRENDLFGSDLESGASAVNGTDNDYAFLIRCSLPEGILKAVVSSSEIRLSWRIFSNSGDIMALEAKHDLHVGTELEVFLLGFATRTQQKHAELAAAQANNDEQ